MDKTVGVLGGGQLGRMLAEAANRLNIKLLSLDRDDSPTKQITAHGEHVAGSFKDPAAIRLLASKCDVLTIEIEHVDVEQLKHIEESQSTVAVHPSWQTIASIQDKYLQKTILAQHQVPVAQSIPIDANSTAELARVADLLSFPFMLKSRRDAYDGRGNYVVNSASDLNPALAALASRGALYAERWAPFIMELAVMVVRTATDTLAFPTVETVHENSICKLVYAPARGLAPELASAAQELAKRAVDVFHGKGVYAVEMFLLPDDCLLVNEIAPRPHNSGHFTIEACYMSQYDAHLHAILDLPIPPARLRQRQPAVMLNILGGNTPDAHLQLARDALSSTGSLHLYGKGAGSPGRKMGHITITAATMAEAEAEAAPLIRTFEAITGGSSSHACRQTAESAVDAQVAIIMGSDSDLPVMLPGIRLLEKLDISHVVRITSAHRTPDLMAAFAREAVNGGIKVIIAGAGGAAHLPGMVASHTTLPVIGVPVRGSVLDGVDSLYSIVQMPRGVPVATVGISNSTNGALLAARILAVNDERVRRELADFAASNQHESLSKDQKLRDIGAEAYLKQMPSK